MKNLKITLAIAALFAFSQSYAQDVQDVNPKLEKKFAKIDSNSDKAISLDELTAFYDGKKNKTGDAFNVDKMFSNKDKNDDGKLSLEEFATKGKKKAKGKKKGKKKS